ncbi:hydroxyacylglutathione hydrolase, mitochondrial isoform X1 [Melanaphis sacchari]|uniref:hydroxyacylglutathione hydrolase, mitochondrial isoform X1 n=2 Tax=Melanaphis sacchari TaxID=742174 RepID=UPI000DC151CF|nr:hydroxyacylglutathione hydrolase, mitochondrial isoform X1 [Melanaphis sacchari]
MFIKVLSTLPSVMIKKSSFLFHRPLTTMHSNIITKEFGKFKVQVLPALSDNFMYLLIDNSSKEAAIVDPVAPDVVWDAVRKENVKLTTVLTTHHHWDHAGGNKELINSNTNDQLTVIGGDDRIDGLTIMIDTHGVDVQLGSLNIKCLCTPCHTTGHVCYYVNEEQNGVVFTGDTLFLGGCGRFFEGTATQMYKALIKILSQLPDSTAVFCGHEYAIQNLKFGLHVEPSNQHILSKLENIEAKRKIKEPSVPSTIGLEKLINPFMRVENESVQKFTQTIGEPINTMKMLRDLKNNF